MSPLIKPSRAHHSSCIHYLDVKLSFRSRNILRLMGAIAPRLLYRMAHLTPERMLSIQQRAQKMPIPFVPGITITRGSLGGIPSPVFGELNPKKPLVFWLHGGAFMLPAAPSIHYSTAAKLCKSLDACGVMPAYRLAPKHPYPAGLDDCENAYLAALELGFSAKNILLIGDSAGGNLVFGLMQRLRQRGLQMPACAVAISPVAELARASGPPSLYLKRCKDPLLPLAAMPQLAELYFKGQDGSNPELSPLYMDCSGLPPLFFITSSHEILMDDIVNLAERCEGAGVNTLCQVWPKLPHAFPIFERLFPEARIALEDIANFAAQHLGGD